MCPLFLYTIAKNIIFERVNTLKRHNNMKNIVVIGSSNTDMVVKTSHLPAGGETVLGGTFFMNAGGKGANQAVAAARYGNRVVFVAKTGNFGHLQHLYSVGA